VNYPDSQVFDEFPRFPGIWGIPQIPRYLENFPQIYRHLGNSLHSQVFRNFPDSQVFGEFSRFQAFREFPKGTEFLPQI